MVTFSIDEHKCLTISTEQGRFHFFLENRDVEELYGLMENRCWEE